MPNKMSNLSGSCKRSTRTELFARSVVLFESGRAQRLAGNISAAIHKERQAELMLRQALVPEGLGRMLEPLLQEWGRSHHISPLQCEGWRGLVKP